ncbi:MAG: AmmeMemoRadiSam system radical SAM enzyme [Actinomycetota bacterium]|nr:AmmeMemoRadiSam system radical SAM enzyme [Actinomycetota bacterium]
MKEASYFEKLNGGKVRCLLCPQECIIAEGKSGICRVRSNKEGILYSENYERALAINLDPVEKKPLYHFYPGKQILSVGTGGCNQRCDFCQNWEMIEADFTGNHVTSSEIAEMAGRSGSIGVAYTYNEPIIWFEFVLECAEKVRKRGYKNVLVTNGLINPRPLEEILPLIDAMNIDVKSMSEEFYKKICKSKLAPVLNTCRRAKQSCHIEITNLVIPTLNDSKEDILKLVEFVESLGKDTPLHFSAYYPCYKMKIPRTPFETLKDAWLVAKERLDYVYMGNVMDEEGSTSFCHNCGKVIVRRQGYSTFVDALDGNRCAYCGETLPFIV